MIRLGASSPNTSLPLLLAAAAFALGLVPNALSAQVLKGQDEDAVISGTVTDDFGAPLQDIRLEIFSADGRVATARTDKAGDFTATVPASASPVRLLFHEIADLEDRVLESEWYDDVYDREEAHRVSFGGGDEVSLDVSLSRMAVFTGTVVDETGEPIHGISLRFTDDYTECCVIGMDARTDEDGTYEARVPTVSGSTKISIEGRSKYQTLYHGGSSHDTQTRVPAPRNDTVSMDFVMELNPPAIKGRVTEAGKYLEDLADITVMAITDDGYRVSTTTSESGFYSLPLAKAEGPVRLGFVDETGIYEEEWYPDRPDAESAELLTVGPGAPLRIDAELERPDGPEGEVTISGTVTDEAGNPLPNLLMDVWSTEVNPETGQLFFARQFPTGPDGSFDSIRIGNIGELGGAIRVGLYLGAFLGGPFDGHWQGYTGTDRLASSISEAVAIPVVPGANHLDLVVNMPALITGRVTDETGDPISGISVTAWRSGLETTDEGSPLHDGSGQLLIMWTNEDGRYADLIAPADGSTKIQFGHATSAEVSSEFHRDAAAYADAEEVSLDPGGRITVDAVLERAHDPSTEGVIAGTVTSAAGNHPLRDIQVLIYDGADLLYRTRTDKRGEFHRPVAPSERGYHLQFLDTSEPNDFYSEWFDDAQVRTSAAAVPVAAGEEVSIDVELAMAYVTITGTVTNEAGEGLEGIDVYFCDPENSGWSPAGTDENGRYELSVFHTRSGSVQFLDYSGQYVSEWYDDVEGGVVYCFPPTEGEPRWFELQPRAELTLDAVLKRAHDPSTEGVIAGTVSSAAGNPLRNIRVSIFSGLDELSRSAWPTPLWEFRTDERGEFRQTVDASEQGYHIRFDETGHPRQRSWETEWFEDAESWQSVAPLPVAAGEKVRIDVELALIPNATITGTVTNEAGVPLEGIEVWFANIHDGVPVGAGSTDENGRYSFEVHHGDVGWVKFIDWGRDYGWEWYDGVAASETSTVPDAEEAHSFELQPNAEITADAVLARVEDTSEDGSGDEAADPVADADEDTDDDVTGERDPVAGVAGGGGGGDGKRGPEREDEGPPRERGPPEGPDEKDGPPGDPDPPDGPDERDPGDPSDPDPPDGPDEGDPGDPSDPGSPGGPGTRGPGWPRGPGVPGPRGPFDNWPEGPWNRPWVPPPYTIFGDVHVRTLDGARYDFQAAGEFVAARSLDDDFEVQVRMGPPGDHCCVSVTHAVAARVAGDRVSMVADQPDFVWVNGARTLWSDATEDVLPGGGRLLTRGKDHVVYWPDGSRLAVRFGSERMRFGLGPDPERRGRLEGLAGDFDGRRDDDIATAEGEVLEAPVPFETLYGRMAEGWRVRREGALFDYGPGENTETFTDRDFPASPATVETLSDADRRRAETVCREEGVTDPGTLEACVVDVGHSGDESFAAEAAAVQRRDREILGAGLGPEADDTEGRELFEEDLSADPMGSFPSRLELVRGPWEISEIEGERALRYTGNRNGAFSVKLPEVLPDAFILEFDAFLPRSAANRLIVLTSEPEGANFYGTPYPHHYIRLDGNRAGVEHRQRAEQPSDWSRAPVLNEGYVRVRIVVEGRSVAVHVDGEVVARLSDADLPRTDRLWFQSASNASERSPVYVGSLRLVAGTTTERATGDE